MISLYEITGAMARAAEAIQDAFEAEIPEHEREALIGRAMDVLEQSGEDLTAKLDGCVKYRRALEASQRAVRDEEQRLAARRKRLERQQAAFDEYLRLCLMRVEGHRIKTDTWSAAIQLRRNSLLEITDEQMLPVDPRFWRVKKELNKEAIKDALRNGEAVEGARLIDTEVLVVR